MKFLLCADLHASNTLQLAEPISPDGVTDRLEIATSLLEDMFVVANNLGIGHLFFLGDLFDRKNVDLVTMKCVLGKLSEMTAKYNHVCFYILPGNHDAFDSAGWHYSVDIAKLLCRNNIHVMREPVPLISGDHGTGPVTFHPLPYSNRELTTSRLLGMKQHPKTNILLMHHDIVGGKIGEWVCDDGIDPKHLNSWDAVFSGHFHEPQKIGNNIIYVGAMLPLRFGDSAKRGYMVVDVDKSSIVAYEHYVLDGSPVFVDVDLDMSNLIIRMKDYKHRGAYARIKVKGNKEQIKQLDQEWLKQELRSRGVNSFKILFESVEDTKQRIEVTTTTTSGDLVRSYVQDSGVAEGTGLDLKDLIKIGAKCFENGLMTKDTRSGLNVTERAREVRFDDISIKGFASFGSSECVLEFGKHDLVLISGKNNDSKGADSNGAGKSNLFKALTWCLWGQTVDGMGLDVINRDPTIASAQVVAKFTLNVTGGRVQYKVRRFRGKGSKLELSIKNGKDWKDISGKTKADTQNRISDLLGMDMLTFRNTVLYGQGDRNKFSDLDTTDADRKAILKHAMRLDDYDYAQDAAKQEIKRVETDIISPLNSKATSIEIQMGEVDLGVLEQKQQSFEATRQQRIETVQRQIGDIRSNAIDVVAVQAMIADVQQRINDLKEAKQTRGELEKRNKDMEKRTRQYGNEISSLKSDKRNKQEAASNKCDHINRINERPECPECGAKSNSESVDRFVKKLRQEVKQLDEGVNILTGAIDATAVLKDKEEAAQAQIHAQLIEIRDKLDELPSLEREKAAFESEVTLAKKQEADIATRAAEMDFIKSETNEFDSLIEAAKSKLVKLKRGLGKVRGLIADAEQLVSQHEFWVKGFGNQGLPSYILDTVMPTINARTNEYLSILSDGSIVVSMDTESELKGGDKRDKIDIKYDVDGVSGVIPSGGQRKRTSLSIGLALMDVVANREFTRFNIMLLDEVLDGLDKVGKSRVLDLLVYLKGKRETIYVISHDPDVVELFDHEVKVVKSGGHTSIQ